MIHTIVPIEQVLSLEPQIASDKKEQSEIRALYMGEDVLLSRNEEGDFSVERVISTNPQSYLKKELYPGAHADMKKIERIV